jgi:hypothetical protein
VRGKASDALAPRLKTRKLRRDACMMGLHSFDVVDEVCATFARKSRFALRAGGSEWQYRRPGINVHDSLPVSFSAIDYHSLKIFQIPIFAFQFPVSTS